MKKTAMAFCMFFCALSLVACAEKPIPDSLTLGVEAIITAMDKTNTTITVQGSGEDPLLHEPCLIDCSQLPMIYCSYDTQEVASISYNNLHVGDEIILTVQSSEIENLQKEAGSNPKIAATQLQLRTQRMK